MSSFRRYFCNTWKLMCWYICRYFFQFRSKRNHQKWFPFSVGEEMCIFLLSELWVIFVLLLILFQLLILFYLLLTMEHFSRTSSWNFRNRSWTSASLRKKARKWVKGCFLLKVSRRTSIRVRAEITPLRCWPVITVSKKKKRFNTLKDHQLVVK